ncbi:MAG: archaeosine biosynthesis radical SAM protein RaSEA [Pseudomonadota bacterium]
MEKRPAHVERAPASIDGQPATRLIVVLRAIGCAWARQPHGGCTNCGFLGLSTGGATVATSDLIAQIDYVLDRQENIDGVAEIDIYNSGSFLSDVEIPPPVREHCFRRLASLPIRRVVVESRPEYISAAKLASLRLLLGARELEIGIGLESANDHVREALINKGFTRADFTRAVAVIAASSTRLLAYVLVKPLGLDERTAIADAVSTVSYVFDVAAAHGVTARVALQPVFVAPGSALERAYLAGDYRPPSLWSVVEVLRKTHQLGELLVGLSDESLSPRQAPAGCDRCSGDLRTAIQKYNRRRDLAVLDAIDCPLCREDSGR